MIFYDEHDKLYLKYLLRIADLQFFKWNMVIQGHSRSEMKEMF